MELAINIDCAECPLSGSVRTCPFDVANRVGVIRAVEIRRGAYAAVVIGVLAISLGILAQGAWQALTSVERGSVERASPNKFRAAIGFYPHCLGFKGDMTVPTLILIGELDDWSLATECRNMVDGRDDWGISRQKDQGVPIKLIVYPGAYHAFDAAGLTTPVQLLGHHLEYNPSATDQAISAVREFLKATIGGY